MISIVSWTISSALVITWLMLIGYGFLYAAAIALVSLLLNYLYIRFKETKFYSPKISMVAHGIMVIFFLVAGFIAIFNPAVSLWYLICFPLAWVAFLYLRRYYSQLSS